MILRTWGRDMALYLVHCNVRHGWGARRRGLLFVDRAAAERCSAAHRRTGSARCRPRVVPCAHCPTCALIVPLRKDGSLRAHACRDARSA